jgi:hypothetical protein
VAGAAPTLAQPWTTIGVDSNNDWYVDTVGKVGTGTGLPRVRRLELSGNMFSLYGDLPQAIGTRLEQVVADTPYGWLVELTRDGAGWRLAAMQQKSRIRSDPRPIVELLQRLPPEALVALRVKLLDAGSHPLDELRSAAARFPSLSTCELG